MFAIIQHGHERFKILPKFYETKEAAEIDKKRIFEENGGQKSGWYLVVNLDNYIYISHPRIFDEKGTQYFAQLAQRA